MPSEYTMYGDISPRTNFAAWGALLKRTSPGIITERFAQTKPMQKGKGRTMIFRRYIALAAATTPLAEGVPPTGTKPTYVDVECTVEQYGDWIGITDVIEDTHEDPVLTEFNSLLSRQMKETREALNINVVKGGTNVYYTNGAARNAVNTVCDRGDFRKISRDLRSSDAEFYTEVLAGSAKYGTTPVQASFIGLGHTDLEPDLKAVSGFKQVQDYSEPGKAFEYEVGSAENIRFLLTTMFDPWADAGAAGATMLATTNAAVAVDVYPIIIMAPDAWATVPLRGVNSGSIAVVNPKPAPGDPLGQLGTLGWKFWHSAVILNDDLMARLETSATANPV